MNPQQVIECTNHNHINVFKRFPTVLSHGEGPYVYDTDGREYLDFFAGIAVNALGHAHPKIVKAISEQASRMIHCSNIFYNEQQARLLVKLVSLSGLDRAFLTNSGTEAIEGAIKLARKYGKSKSPSKTDIVTAANSFHGRTYGALSATGQKKYSESFSPMLAGFKHVDYDNMDAIENAVDDDTCAVILEAVQGEGGIIVPVCGYLKKAAEVCRRHDALMIVDEIQTGMGRTGLMFAFQREGIRPDVITVGKGLGGGYPIGAFIAREEAAAVMQPGDHGSTFGGNPLGCAVANTVIEVFEEENILDNVNAVGSYLKKRLCALQEQYPDIISEVRGYGLMIGVGLDVDAKDIVAGCLADGAILNSTSAKVLRITPPLNINMGHVDKFMEIFGKVIGTYKCRGEADVSG